jgi:hypothetical protein
MEYKINSVITATILKDPACYVLRMLRLQGQRVLHQANITLLRMQRGYPGDMNGDSCGV